MGLYFHHPACLEHDPRAYMPEHPDTPERLEAIERMLAEHGWSGWEHRAAPPAEKALLELIHSPRHVQRIKELSLAGGGAIDPDTFVSEPSYRAALHAAGGATTPAGWRAVIGWVDSAVSITGATATVTVKVGSFHSRRVTLSKTAAGWLINKLPGQT